MKIFIGLIIILVGFMMVWKTGWFLGQLGRAEWAESSLGIWGGTRLLIKLGGILVIFLAFLLMTGLLGSLVNSLLGLLFQR